MMNEQCGYPVASSDHHRLCFALAGGIFVPSAPFRGLSRRTRRVVAPSFTAGRAKWPIPGRAAGKPPEGG